MNVAAYIDHTVLKPDTNISDIERVCAEALQYKFAAVCIPPIFVHDAKRLISGTEVKLATVVGFPFGYSHATAKLSEIYQAIEDGADEIDAVINLALLKAGKWHDLESEIKLLMPAIRSNNIIIKLIIESGILSDNEILTCCHVYPKFGVHYLKTSTGYSQTGATLHAVQLMRANLPSDVKIKASGGIRTYEAAVQFIEAGADRLGCSSSVSIVKHQSTLS
jgi:deoxyribose-phosphate aldolase